MQTELAISIITVASKMAVARSYRKPWLTDDFMEIPRLEELLLCLEWWNRQPGGLTGFIGQVVDHHRERILPKEFLEIPCDKDGRYALEDLATVFQRMPKSFLPPLTLNENRAVKSAKPKYVLDEDPDDYFLFDFLADESVSHSRKAALAEGFSTAQIDAFRGEFTSEVFTQGCMARCEEVLLRMLIGYFEDPDQKFPRSLSSRENGWQVFADLPTKLIEFMDAHAARALERVAKTRVTSMVFEAMDYAWETNNLVSLLGDSRFGKTESLEAYCAAWPGRFRLVPVPATGGETDLLFTVAEALGLDYSHSTGRRRVKSDVQYILKHCRIGLALDEGHFLIPSTFSRSTPPARLNLIRTEVVDRGRPCLISATPQAYGKALQKFTSRTGYAMEQWLGRFSMKYTLPEELSDEDIIAVSRIHLPNLSDRQRKLIAARALQSEQYLHAMQSIATRAVYLARQDGRDTPTDAHINTATDQFTNGVRAPRQGVQEADGSQSAPAVQTACMGDFPPPKSGMRQLSTIKSRSITPARAGAVTTGVVSVT